jgi:3-methyladenine DNA glycosylase/8-oxoguanine DNA glycosylase
MDPERIGEFLRENTPEKNKMARERVEAWNGKLEEWKLWEWSPEELRALANRSSTGLTGYQRRKLYDIADAIEREHLRQPAAKIVSDDDTE